MLTKENIKVQVASVRVDTISKSLAEGLLKLGAKSITMAVETGSKKLRDTINKKVSNETIFNSIQTIYDAGFKQIKLYGMVGLPFETDDDLKQLLETKPDIILLGTGEKSVILPATKIAVLLEKQYHVECMNSVAACRTYTILIAEGRKVVAGLII